MGKRYSAILTHLKIPFVGVDKDDAIPNKDYTGILIATPTDTHADLIEFYSALRLPILCEKPIARNKEDLDRALKAGEGLLTMVNQYEYLLRPGFHGETFFNYWNSGKDGIAWDTINIIGLSKWPKPIISNKSPIWQCTINGQELSVSCMDSAYCRMIDSWVKNPHQNAHYIECAHNRVFEGEYKYDD